MTYTDFLLRYTGYQPEGSFKWVLVGINGGRREFRDRDRAYRARLAKRYYRRYAAILNPSCPIESLA